MSEPSLSKVVSGAERMEEGKKEEGRRRMEGLEVRCMYLILGRFDRASMVRGHGC